MTQYASCSYYRFKGWFDGSRNRQGRHLTSVAVYIAASQAWLCVVEAQRSDRWDLIGARVVLFGPRAA